MHSASSILTLLFACTALAAPRPLELQADTAIANPSLAPKPTGTKEPAASYTTGVPDSPYTSSMESKKYTSTKTGSHETYPSGTAGSIDNVLPPIVPVNTRANDEDLITKLVTRVTQADRVKLLDQPGDFVFDFNPGAAPVSSESDNAGGQFAAATAKSFPALIGNGAAMTVAFLAPCGFNTPHVHNRATELNIVVKGRLVTNFQVENGVEPIANTMETFQMTVFPQGAIHTEFNPDCDESIFVAAFPNADPGVEQVAQTFFNLRPDVVSATLGGVPNINGADIESFRDMIPANLALGVDACLKKCGIKRNAKRDIGEVLMGSQQAA